MSEITRAEVGGEPKGLDHLLRPKDVAEILGVPVATLYQWRYRQKGPRALRVGRHLRYRQQDLQEFIAGRLLDSSS